MNEKCHNHSVVKKMLLTDQFLAQHSYQILTNMFVGEKQATGNNRYFNSDTIIQPNLQPCYCPIFNKQPTTNKYIIIN